MRCDPPRVDGGRGRDRAGTTRRPAAGLLLAAVVGVLGWNVALVAAPHAVTHHRPPDPRFVAGTTAYVVGAAVCHQRPARSFHLWGAQLPVCARCAGLYVGAGLGLAVAVIPLAGWRTRATDAASARWWLALAAAPTVLTVAAELGGIVDPGNVARATAALPLGVVVAWVAGRALAGGLD